MTHDIDTVEQFIQVLRQSHQSVAVDFWAPWCGPCKAFEPILEEASTRVEGEFRILKVNIEELPGLSREYSVISIPTVVYFYKGKERERAVGIEMVEEVLSRLKANSPSMLDLKNR